MIAPVILVLAFFLVPGVSSWFWDLVSGLCSFIGLDQRVARNGYGLFQFWR
jgi:hypothetical protein